MKNSVKVRTVHVAAGLNGSSKTTFAVMFPPGFANCPNVANADLIAWGLPPFRPEDALSVAARSCLNEYEFAC
jgi:predicted ABC-type ATPase